MSEQSSAHHSSRVKNRDAESKTLPTSAYAGETVLRALAENGYVPPPEDERFKRLSSALGHINAIVSQEYQIVEKSEEEYYHGFDEHIEPLQKACIAMFPAIGRLNEQGRNTVIQAAQAFVSKMTKHPYPESAEYPPVRPQLAMEEDAYEKEFADPSQAGRFPYTLSYESFVHEDQPLHSDVDEKDLIILYTALSFHDSGRFLFARNFDQTQGVRKKKEHELRSIEEVSGIFLSSREKGGGADSPYAESLQALAVAYPDLFDAEHIGETVTKINYLIYNTLYTRHPDEALPFNPQEALAHIQPEERHKYTFLENFQTIPEKERKKLQFLGALTLSMDIGVMQIKADTFENFAGLISEYVDDVDIKPDEKIFTSTRNWVYGWTDDVYEFSSNCYALAARTAHADIFPPLESSAQPPKVFVDAPERVPDTRTSAIEPEEAHEVYQLLPEELRKQAETYGIDEEWSLLEGDPLRRAFAYSRRFRREFLDYLLYGGFDIEKPMNWGDLKKQMDTFYRFETEHDAEFFRSTGHKPIHEKSMLTKSPRVKQ